MNEAMENNLTKPLSRVLADIQDRITTYSHYFGIKTMKNPMDFWVYREIIFAQKPDFIIEIGNFNGGSTLAFAHMLDILGHGKIIAMDINHSQLPDQVRTHPRVILIEGDACKNIGIVKSHISEEQNVLVFEDSAHTFENTLNVLKGFSPFIKPGGYIIVEDSICHHGLNAGPSPGPYEAIEEFLSKNPNFFSDREMENFGITWCPKGYLCRTGGERKQVIIEKGVSLSGSSWFRDTFRKAYIQIMPPIIVSTIRRIRGRS